MKFLFNEQAGSKQLKITDKDFIHLCKSQRKKPGELINIRNLADNLEHTYQIELITRKYALLNLQNTHTLPEQYPAPALILGWALVDPQTIRHTIPFLSQLGLSELVLINTKRSQGNFAKINTEKLQQIVIKSMQQSGRQDIMKVSLCTSLQEFVTQHPETYLLDISGSKPIDDVRASVQAIVVGPEGGFEPEEISLIKPERIVRFKTDNILKSETAAIAAVSKILL